jgi:hypothetical protein
MRIGKTLNGVLVTLAVVGFCLPEPLLLAAAGPQGPVATDVALRDGGVLVGQVVDTHGAGVGGTDVSVRQGTKEPVATKSRPDGSFAVKGLRGGVYQIAAADGHGVYRLWTAGTAPPAASNEALLVTGKNVVRGQQDEPGPWKTFLTNPFVIAAIVCTAVAIPVALHNAHHGPASP